MLTTLILLNYRVVDIMLTTKFKGNLMSRIKKNLTVVISEETLQKINVSIPKEISRSQYIESLIIKGLESEEVKKVDIESTERFHRALSSIVKVGKVIEEYAGRVHVKCQ